MKHNKILRVLAAAIIISLLALVIPATPAAAASLTLSPTSGRAGTSLTVTGTAFPTGTYIAIQFNYSPKGYVQLTGAETSFSTTITVPALDPGIYAVRAVDGAIFTPLTTDIYFTIISAEITIDPDEGTTGTEVDIDGAEFDASEDITIEYDGDEISIDSGDEDTDSSGDFSCTIIIPESTAGDHTITVTGESSNLEAEAEFTIEPEISLNTTSGSAGDKVTISGTGFKKDKEITVDFDGTELSTDIETDDDGSFSGTFTVPSKVNGSYKVEASDGSNEEDLNFTVASGASINKTTGSVGTEVTISGKGFIAGGTITIKYGNEEVATTTADTNGAFTATFEVPTSAAGIHTITATDGTNAKQLSFTMESTAPPVPSLSLPLDNIKAEAETIFDWGDVEDDSGVTYTLQVATNKEFTSTAIVLEKTGLTNSEYTITKEEKLESVKQEAPYYWRVQAMDGASNAGEWSEPRSFYVGFTFGFGSFGMPGWAIYSLMGLGAVLCGFIGFWLGRRTAYSSYY